MTKSILTSVATSVLIGLAAIASQANAQAILNENFESMNIGPINNQNGWTVGGTSTTSLANIASIDSTKALYLEDSDNTKNPKANYYLGEDLTSGYVEFSVYFTGGNSALGFYTYKGDASAGTERSSLLTILPAVGKGLQLTLQMGGTAISGADTGLVSTDDAGYVDGWNTLRFVFDKEAGTASLLVNGNSVAGLALQNILFPEDWSIGTIQFTAGANASTGAKGYIDNVIVSNQTAIPEPANATFVLSILVGMIFCLRRHSRY